MRSAGSGAAWLHAVEVRDLAVDEQMLAIA